MEKFLPILLIVSLAFGAGLAGYSDSVRNLVVGSGGFVASSFLTSPVADADISSAATWNAKQSALTFSYPLLNTGGTVSDAFSTTTAQTFAALTSTGAVTANNFNSTGSTLPQNGFTTSAANTLTFTTNTTAAITIGSTQITSLLGGFLSPASSTVSGLFNMGNASSSQLTVSNNAYLNTFAASNTTGTSTIANALAVGTTTMASTGNKLMVQGSAVTQEIKVATSSSFTIDLNTGNQQFVGLGAATTITLSNGYVGGAYRLILCQDGTGSRVVTWGSPISWAGGTVPTLTTTANKCDVISLLRTMGTTTPTFIGGASLNY